MSLGLLLPAGLAALAALLLPLLIHLSRQSEQRPTDFAALRWLGAQPRPRQRLHFEDIALLLLRLLLVVALAMLLARPVLWGGTGDAPWVVVAPEISAARARALLDRPGAQWRWLANGFPDLATPPPQEPQPVASLLREIDAILPANTTVTVVVPEEIAGLDAARIQLSRNVVWQVVPGATPVAAPTLAGSAPTLVIRHAPDRQASLRYLRAAAMAWRVTDLPITTRTTDIKLAADVALISQPLPPNAVWLVWLAPGSLPSEVRTWIENGGVAVLDAQVPWPALAPGVAQWRDDTGQVLAQGAALGRGRIVQLMQPLQPQYLPELLEAEFPDHLRALFEGPGPAPQRALATSVQPMRGGSGFPETPRPLQDWLIVLIAGLFVVERWLASSPRRGPAA